MGWGERKSESWEREERLGRQRDKRRGEGEGRGGREGERDMKGPLIPL